ncbi:MAG: phosphonate C-P lyase system protein PhnH [Pseudomonadota bacterium]
MQATSTLTGGFKTPAMDAAHAFRAAMQAMARPGTLQTIHGGTGPAPISPAAACLLLTLCDATTNVFLGARHDTKDMRDWLAFHTGAPIVTRAEAQFALGTWGDLHPLADYSIGTPEYPDRSATLIVERDMLDTAGAKLRGPGIATTATLNLPDIDAFRANRALFPLGLDFYFTCGSTVAGLPRSTEVL